ncbi:type II toxin-antitoxin system VapC family toxin [Phenylobacterium sp.]|uniref:type II toxin-antitoxin system VapC family toxin n=1 Tax=Phenylobacterium sp. TaxID=1871053 RepID=UPI0025CDEB0B|nr:type II toxin-antitoxin system VapC family toxin [Phenylobacterium sp.]
MIAIDTNLIVRALTGDDAEQSARVRALLGEEDLFVPTTVLLEAEWVLRTVYRLDASRAIEAFVGLPRIRLEHPQYVSHALKLARAGFDFADALHHAAAGAAGCDSFLTFDRELAKLPQTEAPPVRLL